MFNLLTPTLVLIVFIFSQLLNAGVNTTTSANKETKPIPPPAIHTEVPIPSPSEWCKNNPDKCIPRKPQDPLVNPNLANERCMDNMGNGDGFISEWEVQTFGDTCP